MQIIHKFLSYFLLFSAVSVHGQGFHTITQNFVDSAQELLNAILGGNAFGDSVIDQILGHGCWCSKLDQFSNKNIIGGTSPIDEVDAICREWFLVRNCNDNYVGGTCFGLDNVAFTYQVENNNCSPIDLNQPTAPFIFFSTCEFDSCLIDTKYVNQLILYIFSTNTNWVSIPVTDASTCPQGFFHLTERHCVGVPPNLSLEQGPPPVTSPYTGPVTTTAVPSSSQVAEACNDAEFDLTILVDGSGSVRGSNYQLSWQFVQNLVDSLTIGDDNTKITIAQFSFETTTYCVLSNSRSVIDGAINTAKNDQDRRTTHTSFAIQTMMNHMATNGRVGVPQVMIVMTDGAATGGLDSSVIDAMHAAGIITFAIGIGAGADQNELAEIATDPDSEFLFSLENFGALSNISPGITQAICSSNGSRSVGGDRAVGDPVPSDQVIKSASTYPGDPNAIEYSGEDAFNIAQAAIYAAG